MQEYIEEREGGYYLADSRIALDSIVNAFRRGESLENILDAFPLAGPLAKINGAITFYLENTDQMERYLQDQDRLWDDLGRVQSESDSKLAERLRDAKARADTGTR